MNSIAKEIALEARRSHPIGWKLAGVCVGDIVYVGNGRDILRPAQVEKVGKIHLTASGVKYSIETGLMAGKPERGMGFTRARPYSDELHEKYALHKLKGEFDRQLAVFRSKPEAMTKETLTAILRIINPEAWK